MHIAGRKVDIEKVFPLMEFFDDSGVAVSLTGVITLGWEVTYPTLFSCDEDAYDALCSRFVSAVRVLPEWTVVHRQDTFFRESYHDPVEPLSYLAKANSANFEGREYIEHRSFIFISLGTRGQVDKPGRLSGLVRPFVKGAAVPGEDVFSRFLSHCESFRSVLSSGSGVRMRRLDRRDWLGEGLEPGIVQRYMMLGGKGPAMSDVALSRDSVSVFDRRACAFVIGDSDQLPPAYSTVSKVGALESASGSVYLSYGASLGCLLDCEHVLNQVLMVLPQEDVRHQIESEKKKMNSGIRETANRLNAEQIERFLDASHGQRLDIVNVHENIILWGRSDAEMMELFGKVQTAFSQMDIRPVYCNYSMPSLYYFCIPGNASEAGSEEFMRMELLSAAGMMPMETFDRGQERGLLTLCDRQRFAPLRVDTQRIAYDKGLIDSYNAFVIGPTGSGKSFLMNHYARSCYDAGEYVFIVDKGHSYEGLCRIIAEESKGVDGKYLTWDMDKGKISFSLFDGIEYWLDSSGRLRQDEPGVGAALSFFQTVWSPKEGWTSDNLPILRVILTGFISTWLSSHPGKTPVFDDFFSYLGGDIKKRIKFRPAARVKDGDGEWRPTTEKEKDAETEKDGFMVGGTPVTVKEFNIDACLRAFMPYSSDGDYGFLLNDPAPPDLFSTRFTVCEVNKLSEIADETFYSVCILLIMNTFDRRMQSDRKTFKTLIIEEAWKAIANQTMAPYLMGLWKTCRKYNAAAVVVTQQLSDITSAAAATVIQDTILVNSPVKMILKPDGNLEELDTMVSVLGLSSVARNLVFSMNQVQNPFSPKSKEVCILLGTSHVGVYSTEVSAKEALVYESQTDRKAPLLDLAVSEGSLRRAADILSAKKTQKKGEEESPLFE